MVDNAAVTGGGIDYGTAAGCNSHMAVYNNDVAGLNIGEVIDPGVAAYIAPSGRRYVTLIYAHLVQTPVNKAGAVEGVGTFGAPYIGSSQL